MAARLYPAPQHLEVVDLRRLTARDLEPLLEEECASWLDELAWDFEKSADLVRRFVDMRALNGGALIEHDQVVGYMYWVLEEDKGLIGDLYVRRSLRTPAREDALIEAALEPIMLCPPVVRIESQLMLIPWQKNRSVPRSKSATLFARNFMRIDLTRAALGRGHVRRPMYVEKWHDHYSDAAAQLIAAAYDGHIDSRINDQYRSAAGRAPLPAQHRAVSRMRRVLPPGVLRGLRSAGRSDVRRVVGQHRCAGHRSHHADLRIALGARHRHRPRVAAAIADHAARDGLSRRNPYGNRGE